MAGNGMRTLTPADGHGDVRGATLSRRSPQFEGRFGRMFRTLPPAQHDEGDLANLGAAMSADPEVDTKGRPAAAFEDPKTKFQDAEENAGIDAGYTYLGQFIDHDLTFDPASSLQRQNDPEGLVDFRTPRLDLDCLYGRGPDDQPYMYHADARRFLLGRELTADGARTSVRDLPRHHWTEKQNGAEVPFDRALIGDKRNDENVIVSQLHAAMLQVHNRFVEDRGLDFATAQRMVRWHYQWVVLHDFLPRVVGRETVESILPHLQSGLPLPNDPPKFRFYEPQEEPFIPIEFSAAAYRFGHSMVRPIYRLNQQMKGGEDPRKATDEEVKRGLAGRLFIFAGIGSRGLNGFRAFPEQWAIDWSLFFDINGSGSRVGKARVQPAYKIDPSLVNPLAFLPEFSDTVESGPLTLESLQAKAKPGQVANLAHRNLLRGLRMSLPSGQTVARAMGIAPIPDEELRIGKATSEDAKGNPSIVEISSAFAGNAPLWAYVLAEALVEWQRRATAAGKTGADADRIPVVLGPVGGRIVAETLIGILVGDSHSFLRQDPAWRPTVASNHGTLTMGDLVAFGLRL